MSRRRIVIARHGQTAWNAAGKLQGHADICLDDVGRGQARTLADSLGDSKIAAVWTSDLLRARETGVIVAMALGLAAPRVEPALRERKFGVFEGLTRDECATRHPEHWQAWTANTTAPPGGEHRSDAVARMRLGLERVAASTPVGGPILVVTHGGVMRLWLMDLLGRSVPLIANGSTYIVDHDDGLFSPVHVPR